MENYEWKTTKMEDAESKITKKEDDQNGRQPKSKTH